MKKYIFLFVFISCASEESRLADTYYSNKNYIKAIEYYSESLKLKPNDTKSLYRRGRSYEETKQFDKALKDYNKVITLDKNNTNAILSLAVNSLRNKKYNDAEQYAKKVIKINPDLHNSYYLLGRSQQYQGLFSSISINADFPESYYYLGLVYLKLKNDKIACKNFSIASSLNYLDATKIQKRYCY